jgi:hypothetical protein
MRDPYGDDLPESAWCDPYTGPVRYVAECSCGRRYSGGQWRALTLVGIVRPGDGEKPEAIQMRNCTACGSTLGVDLDVVDG